MQCCYVFYFLYYIPRLCKAQVNIVFYIFKCGIKQLTVLKKLWIKTAAWCLNFLERILSKPERSCATAAINLSLSISGIKLGGFSVEIKIMVKLKFFFSKPDSNRLLRFSSLFQFECFLSVQYVVYI